MSSIKATLQVHCKNLISDPTTAPYMQGQGFVARYIKSKSYFCLSQELSKEPSQNPSQTPTSDSCRNFCISHCKTLLGFLLSTRRKNRRRSRCNSHHKFLRPIRRSSRHRTITGALVDETSDPWIPRRSIARTIAGSYIRLVARTFEAALQVTSQFLVAGNSHRRRHAALTNSNIRSVNNFLRSHSNNHLRFLHLTCRKEPPLQGGVPRTIKNSSFQSVTGAV